MRTIYSFEITNRKKRYYTLLSNIFLLLTAIAYILFRYSRYEQHIGSFFGSLFLPIAIFLVILLRFIFMIRHKNILFTQLHFASILAICWASQYQYLFAAVIFLLGVFEYFVNRDTVCVVSEQGVQLNTFPARNYKWPQLENVMIKSGMFTIDRKDNHIFQVDVSDETLSFTEDAFNAFCEKQGLKDVLPRR
jgi:hypothetical protein